MKRRTSKPAARQSLVWTDATPLEAIPAGRSLSIEDQRPFALHFGLDGWQGVTDRPSFPVGRAHRVSLQRTDLRGETLNFTRFYPSETRWEGVDHSIRIGEPPKRPDR